VFRKCSVNQSWRIFCFLSMAAMKKHLLLSLMLGTGSLLWTVVLPAATTSRSTLNAVLEGHYYSPEAVHAIEEKLDATPDLLAAATELASNKTNEIRIIASQLLAASRDVKAAPVLWKLVSDESEPVGIMAVASINKLNQFTPVPLDASGLSSPRPRVRRLAAEAVGYLGLASAEPALLRAANDPDDLVRLRAIMSLERCGSVDAAPVLISHLRDPNRNVRKSAASVLGRYGNLSAVEPLVAALEDSDCAVRVTAMNTLSRLIENGNGERIVIQAAIRAKLHKDDYVLLMAARELGVSDNERCTEALIQALLSEDNLRGARAMEFIRRLRLTSTVPALLRNCSHPNVEVRRRIFFLLNEIGNDSCASAWTAALADRDQHVVLYALTAATKYCKTVAPDLIAEKLMDPNPHIRAAAARFYGEAGETRYASKISRLLFDDNRFVRSVAAETLVKFGDRSAVTPLIESLTQQFPGGEPNGTAGGTNPSVVIGCGNDTLLDYIGREMVRHKQEAIRILGDMRATEAVSVIIASGLRSDCTELRATSAYALGQIGDRRAVQPLLEMLRDFYALLLPDVTPDGMIEMSNTKISAGVRLELQRAIRFRASAVWALGRIGDTEAVPLLRQALRDPNGDVRTAAAEALVALHEPLPSNN
jgi:HEAT repeat protein